MAGRSITTTVDPILATLTDTDTDPIHDTLTKDLPEPPADPTQLTSIFSFEAEVASHIDPSPRPQDVTITHVTCAVGAPKTMPDGTTRAGTPYVRLRIEDPAGNYAFPMVMANRDESGRLDTRWATLFEAMGLDPRAPVRFVPTRTESGSTTLHFTQGSQVDISLVGASLRVIVGLGTGDFADRPEVKAILPASQRSASASTLFA